MELTMYKKLRTAVQSNASPAGEHDVQRLEQRLREVLMSTGIFEDVEVDHTDNLDGMVIAMCTFPAHLDEAQVAARLELAWHERLRYEFWEAHSTLVDDGQVEFLGATRVSSPGAFVTVHLVAQKGPIPAQRIG